MLGLVVLVACSSGDDDDERAVAEDAPVSSTTASAPPPDLEAGRAIVEAGGERFTFILHECLVGEETGSPNRRLALSASTTEPFLEADEVLNVDILVSTATGAEDHVIAITRRDRPTLGAADSSMPSRGGPAPDDWITVDAEAGVVSGAGFELRAIDGAGEPLADGTLIADC